MLKAFVYYNLSKENYCLSAEKINKKLKSFEDLCLILSKEGQEYFKEYNDYCISDADFIISVGGDGTLLQAGKLALQYNLPIVGINAGRSGFLCKYSIQEFLACDYLDLNEATVSKRSVLEASFNNEKYFALNDFVFSSKNAGYTIVTSVKTEHRDLLYHASGVIVSTPTGSTAFNASANNCILDSNLDVNIITPICPCGDEKRTYVINNSEAIVINNYRPEDLIDIYCDGKHIGVLSQELKIHKSRKKLNLII